MRNKLSSLKDRAEMLRLVRDFFYKRDVMEVDCPLVSARASVDAHIDLISADNSRFLHSSPEYGMKRLIAEGAGDIFQLSHVFRKGELGNKHNPEFMMAEWYRLGISFQQMIDETVAFINLFIDERSFVQMSYRYLFQQFTAIDIALASVESLKEYCKSNKIIAYEGIEEEGIDGYLNLILAENIEPHLGKDHLFVLTHYPLSQAALAKKAVIDGYEVAERFEIYHKGVELANGYHELSDAEEQHQRLLEANQQRERQGKDPLPLDMNFLHALEKGLPDCCGVAVGFDRCMMIRHAARSIADVIPFEWEKA